MNRKEGRDSEIQHLKKKQQQRARQRDRQRKGRRERQKKAGTWSGTYRRREEKNAKEQARETVGKKETDADQDKQMEKEKPAMGCRTESEKKEGQGTGHKNREERYREAKKKIAAAWEREGYRGGVGRDQDAEGGQQGNEGPGLTATLALGAAGRMCQFRRLFLLLLPSSSVAPATWLSST